LAILNNSSRSNLISFSIAMRKIPRAARLRPKGSLSPVGILLISKYPAIVSILDAIARAIPSFELGSLSPEYRGRYCSLRAIAVYSDRFSAFA
jgi:hypothetical protein